LALVKNNLLDLGIAAAMVKMSEDDLVALASNSQFEKLAEAEEIRMIQSGELQRLRSKGSLNKVLDLLDGRLDDDELPLGTLLKSGEFLHRVSGIEQERAAELRIKPDEAPRLNFAVLYEGDPEPDWIGKGDGFGMIIRMGGARPGAEKVIGGGAA
jgi:hypothetical protein